MPLMSFFDPEFDLMLLEDLLFDLEIFISNKKSEVDHGYDKWIEGVKKEDLDSEWYGFMEDGFIDEMFMASLVEDNLLASLVLSVNRVFEQHVSTIIRQLGKRIDGFVMDERHTYTMKEFKGVMKKSNFENCELFLPQLQDKFRIYMEIRNCLIHKEGHFYNAKDEIKSFILKNQEYFKVDKNLEKFSVKTKYIRQLISDTRKLFKLILYDAKGQPISLC